MELDGNIYYITRSWPSSGKSNSCGLLRVLCADSLRKIGNVVIVTPSYDSEASISDEIVSFPYSTKGMLKDNVLQACGAKEDYLDNWVHDSFAHLKGRVKRDDVMYATTGGELACIKLGSLLKEECGCRFIIHFRDPVDGDIIFGKKIVGYYGINRKRLIDKYCDNADAFITTNEVYSKLLGESHRSKGKKVYTVYSGYSDKIELPLCTNRQREAINIVYAGTATAIQSPEVLYKAVRNQPGVQMTYIVRNPDEMKKEMPEDNIKCIPLMEHDKFLQYMTEKADVGFVSLKGEYSRVFIPSKIYEYANLGLPILAAVRPNGAAADIIRNDNLGIVCREDDIDGLIDAVESMRRPDTYEEYRKAVLRNRNKYSYRDSIEPVFLKYMEEILEE